MEHTNLFLYENDAALQADYPNGKVDDVIPGVAYARTTGNEDPTVIYNGKKTVYVVTLNLKNRSGATIGASSTVQTPEAVEGDVIKVNIVAPEVANYKPSILVEKIEVSANTSHDVVYNSLTSYTVTVHHMFEGTAITADTTVLVDDIYETESKRVTIVPENIPGYTASAVNLTVSGNMEYTLEYTQGCVQMEYVDLDLPSGTLWATTNLGATSITDPGDYYAWGEIIPKTEFTLNNYRFFDSANSEYTKYIEDLDDKQNLDIDDDAVCQSVCGGGTGTGAGWYTPSEGMFYELINNTTPSTGTVGGENVIIFTSNNNGNQLIFPIDGHYDDNGFNEGATAFWSCWKDTPNGQAYGYGFCDTTMLGNSYDRYWGLHIRPIYYTGNTPGPVGPVVASINPSFGKNAGTTNWREFTKLDIPEMSENGVKRGSRPGVLFVKFYNANEEKKDETTNNDNKEEK